MNRRIPPAVLFARLAALVVSLGVATWLIVGAQSRAEDVGAATPGPDPAATVPGWVPVFDKGGSFPPDFLPSSKFGPVSPPAATDQRR